MLRSSPTTFRYWLLQQYRVALFRGWTVFGHTAYRLREMYFRFDARYFDGIDYAQYEAIPDDAITNCPLCGGPVESRT